jgi:hypothetical protein
MPTLNSRGANVTKQGVRCYLIAAAALLIGIAAGWKASEWLAVDSCLDAGGAWEYQGSYCYGAKPAR